MEQIYGDTTDVEEKVVERSLGWTDIAVFLMAMVIMLMIVAAIVAQLFVPQDRFVVINPAVATVIAQGCK